MEKHTDGPWKAEQVDLHGDDPTRWSVLSAKGYFVATIENGQPGDCLETESANARLIAAAPEMLEVLQEVALAPFDDSKLRSLLETLRTRASSVIDKIYF